MQAKSITTPRATPIPQKQIDKSTKSPDKLSTPLNQTSTNSSKSNLIPSTFYKTTISFSQKTKEGSPLSNLPSARKKTVQPTPTVQPTSTLKSTPSTTSLVKKPSVPKIVPNTLQSTVTPRAIEPAPTTEEENLSRFEVEEMMENLKMEQQQKFDEWKQQVADEMHTILLSVQQLTNKVIQLESQVQNLQEKGEQKLQPPVQNLEIKVDEEQTQEVFSNNTTLSYPIQEEIRSDLLTTQLTSESNISYSAKPVVLDEAELREKLAAKDLLVDDTISLHNHSDNFDDLLGSPITSVNSQNNSNPTKESPHRFNQFSQIEKELARNAEFFDEKSNASFLEQDDKINNFIVSVVDKKLKLWDIQTNFCIQTISNTDSPIHSATFLSDNLILISDTKSHVKLFDIEKGIDFKINEISSKEGDTISHLITISNFCFTCVNSKSKSILHIWKLNSVGEWQHTCQMDCQDSITCVVQLQSQFLIIGTETGSIKIWKVSHGYTVCECVATLTHHISVQCVCKLSNTCFASGGKGDTRIHLWEMKIGTNTNSVLETLVFENKGTLDGHTNTICALCKLSNKLLLSSSVQDHSLRVWNWKTRECVQNIKREGTQFITQLWRVHNDEFVSLNQAGQVQLWSKSSDQLTFKEVNKPIVKEDSNEVINFIFGE